MNCPYCGSELDTGFRCLKCDYKWQNGIKQPKPSTAEKYIVAVDWAKGKDITVLNLAEKTHLGTMMLGQFVDSNLLAEKDRTIAELTEQLENSVQLPFKVGAKKEINDLATEYGKEEITEECKEECSETEKLYGVYGEDNEGVPCDNPNKIFSDIKMAKEYAILQKGKIAWGIAPVYEIFPKTVYEKVKKIDVRE